MLISKNFRGPTFWWDMIIIESYPVPSKLIRFELVKERFGFLYAKVRYLVLKRFTNLDGMADTLGVFSNVNDAFESYRLYVKEYSSVTKVNTVEEVVQVGEFVPFDQRTLVSSPGFIRLGSSISSNFPVGETRVTPSKVKDAIIAIDPVRRERLIDIEEKAG